MNVQPQLEELEDRSVPSVADLVSFQQLQLPALKAEFHALVPIVQTNLQNQLNQIEALAPAFPAAFQPLLKAIFAQEQQFIKSFPVLADAWFHQTLAGLEAHLLSQQDVSPVFLGPGFLPLGFPGVLPVGGGGVGFSSGFTSGSSGFSGGSGSWSGDPPSIAGRGMGGGLMTTVGAMTLPASNQP